MSANPGHQIGGVPSPKSEAQGHSTQGATAPQSAVSNKSHNNPNTLITTKGKAPSPGKAPEKAPGLPLSVLSASSTSDSSNSESNTSSSSSDGMDEDSTAPKSPNTAPTPLRGDRATPGPSQPIRSPKIRNSRLTKDVPDWSEEIDNAERRKEAKKRIKEERWARQKEKRAKRIEIRSSDQTAPDTTVAPDDRAAKRKRSKLPARPLRPKPTSRKESPEAGPSNSTSTSISSNSVNTASKGKPNSIPLLSTRLALRSCLASFTNDVSDASHRQAS
ncbi:hypothetical protein CBOM_03516 [Ceraceosorus bombacis]|uniref:Uncharacterized protein n=1 Tax=Ceraceosorus bombacis TaxID=401625 RepID=A0A0P1BGP0_9BASI|nr:hypothetical protein CBOM_03516 [Ceraceosorus bombacis]